MARHVLAVGIYVALGFVLAWPVWHLGPATYMQAGGDQWRNVWFFEWNLHALEHAGNPLFSRAANYPGGVNLLLNTGQPLLGFLLSPVTLLFGPIATFNTVITLAPPASATAAYVLFRRFTTWTPAAFAGGLLYGFGPMELLHFSAGQVNLIFTAFIPLIFLALYHVIASETARARRWGIVLGLLIAAQFLVSSELLLDTVISGVVAVIVAAILAWRQVPGRLRHAVRGLAWGVAVAVVLAGFPAWYLTLGPGRVNGPVQLVSQAYHASLLAPVVPDSAQLIHLGAWLSFADRFANGENGSYLGLPLLLAVLGGVLWMWRNKVVIVATVTGIVAFVMSLGAALTIRSPGSLNASGELVGRFALPERFFEKAPLLENLIPVRFALIVALCAGLVGAVALDRLHQRLLEHRHLHRPRRRAVAATAIPAVLAAVALVPLLPAHLLQGVTRDQTPAGFVEAAKAVPAGSVAVVVPFPSGNQPVPILWQARAGIGFRMPGGSFFVPQGPRRRVAFSGLLGYTYDSATAETLTNLDQGNIPPETAQTRHVLLSQWRAWRVRSLLAVPSVTAKPAATEAFLTWLLGRPTASVGLTLAWYHLGETSRAG